MRIITIAILALGLCATRARCDWNEAVLRAARSMPSGGGYSVSSEASERFRASVRVSAGRLVVDARGAAPSYCSSATYLVLLRVIASAQAGGELHLPPEAVEALAPSAQGDGEGIWGRWNANGPGAARLFHALGIGRNFTSFDEARPGDFLKIFWTGEVGRRERGHLVVYLGREGSDDSERVRFWSSNKPGGCGEKSVARSEIARAIFSRLERPEKFADAGKLPATDRYLAGLLESESSFAEACALTGAR